MPWPLISVLPNALIWVFHCILVAIVAGAATGSRTSYWKRGLVGALVGAAFGISMGAPINVVGSVTFFLTTLLPSPLDRLSPILLIIAAAAFVGLAVGLLEARSVPVVRRCVIVGGVFGAILSLANTVVISIVSFVLAPVYHGDSFVPILISFVVLGLVPMIVRATVDVSLTAFAFRFVRRRWPAPSPATGAET